MLVSAAIDMATAPTVPAPVASTPAASSTPAAPSTPSTSSAATTSTTTVAPASTQTTPQTQTEPQSLEKRLQEKIAAGFKKEDATQTDATSATEAAAEEAAAAAGETEAGEAATLDGEQGEGQTTGQTDGEEFDIDFNEPSPEGPKALSERLAKNPALKAAIDADPEFRDRIFADARLAARERQYADLFGSPESARVVADGHQAFANLRNLMGSVKPGDMQSTQAVISAMLEQGALRDENGELLRDANGRMVTDGTVGRFLNNALRMRLENIEAEAKQNGDDETLASLDHIMERVGLRAPSSVAEDGLSEELQAERSRIEQERQQLNQERAQRQQEAQTAHENAVFSKIDSSLDKSLGLILDRATGLNDFTRSKVETDLRAGLMKAVRNNPAYQSELDRVERMPLGPKREQAHVALATRYIHEHLLSVARPILAEAGITLAKSAADAKAAQAARADATRSEIKGSSAPAHAQQAQTPAEKHAQLKAELTKQLGREPSLEEMLAAKIRSPKRLSA